MEHLTSEVRSAWHRLRPLRDLQPVAVMLASLAFSIDLPA
jgi:hypothetical protein